MADYIYINEQEHNDVQSKAILELIDTHDIHSHDSTILFNIFRFVLPKRQMIKVFNFAVLTKIALNRQLHSIAQN